MSVNDFRMIDELLVVTPTTSQSAEDDYFDRLSETEEVEGVTVERGNLHTKTVNYVYPDGRVISRSYRLITSRKCDSTDNIHIKEGK